MRASHGRSAAPAGTRTISSFVVEQHVLDPDVEGQGAGYFSARQRIADERAPITNERSLPADERAQGRTDGAAAATIGAFAETARNPREPTTGSTRIPMDFRTMAGLSQRTGRPPVSSGIGAFRAPLARGLRQHRNARRQRAARPPGRARGGIANLTGTSSRPDGSAHPAVDARLRTVHYRAATVRARLVRGCPS